MPWYVHNKSSEKKTSFPLSPPKKFALAYVFFFFKSRSFFFLWFKIPPPRRQLLGEPSPLLVGSFHSFRRFDKDNSLSNSMALALRMCRLVLAERSGGRMASVLGVFGFCFFCGKRGFKKHILGSIEIIL